MSPEEHLRHLRSDEVWNLEAPRRSRSRVAGSARSRASGGRGQIWTTAVVAAAVVAGAGLAIGLVPHGPTGFAGPGAAPASRSPEPVASAAPSEQATASATPVPSEPATAVPEVVRSSGGTPPQITPSVGPDAVEPSAASQRARSHGDLPALAFVAADHADVARAQRVIACLHVEGVEFVDLTAADAEGVRYLAFGGAADDQRSITLGLQHADECIAAAGR